MDVKSRLNLIKEVGEEIVKDGDLQELLTSGKELIAYDGFEPSDNVQIGTNELMTGISEWKNGC